MAEVKTVGSLRQIDSVMALLAARSSTNEETLYRMALVHAVVSIPYERNDTGEIVVNCPEHLREPMHLFLETGLPWREHKVVAEARPI